jgi:hypothetical protein
MHWLAMKMLFHQEMRIFITLIGITIPVVLAFIKVAALSQGSTSFTAIPVILLPCNEMGRMLREVGWSDQTSRYCRDAQGPLRRRMPWFATCATS